MEINPHTNLNHNPKLYYKRETKPTASSEDGKTRAMRKVGVGVKPRLIVGLGNPGGEYDQTYHNVGFSFLGHLTDGLSPPRWQAVKGKNFKYSELNNSILIKPLVFMNDSGKAVKAALKYFSTKTKIKPQEILIIHDDSDIELGKYKLSFGRGSAGHRGVQSIIKALGSDQFWRLRIGIRKINLRKKAGDFVLKKISPVDRRVLEKTFGAINLGET